MQHCNTLAADKADRADVYITDALTQRHVAPPADANACKSALLDIAETMAEHPAEVLPKFVELAMTLTGAVSAGLSLFEEYPAPGIFRWKCLQGQFACFEGATTPRDDSPCGVTLDQDRPVLARHPENLYGWIADSGIAVPEVLLVPLHLAGAEPLGTLWVVAPREGYFGHAHADIAMELAFFAGKALRMIREQDRLRTALDEQEVLAREMNHRLMNLFAMAEGMIVAGLSEAKTMEEMAAGLSGRLRALAHAHRLVSHSARAAARKGAEATDLASLVEAIVCVHEAAAGAAQSRFHIEGPHLACGDQMTTALALVVHELATNAAKYGALSRPEGCVHIAWDICGDRLELRWIELGGPPLAGAPERRGFGSTLIGRTIQRLRGTIRPDWLHTGLCVTLTMPLDRSPG